MRRAPLEEGCVFQASCKGPHDARRKRRDMIGQAEREVVSVEPSIKGLMRLHDERQNQGLM